MDNKKVKKGTAEMKNLDSLEQDYDDIPLEIPAISDADIHATYNNPEYFCDEVVLDLPEVKRRRRRYEPAIEKAGPSPDQVIAFYRNRGLIPKDGSIRIDDSILLPNHKGLIIDLTYVGDDLMRIHPYLYWCSKEKFQRSPLEKFIAKDKSIFLLRTLKIEDLLELK